MAAVPPARKRVSKSTLSMFLRTRCDRELYLSLHDKAALAAAGLPTSVKRPGIGTLSVVGKDFESARNDQLTRLFAGIARFARAASGDYRQIPLEPELVAITGVPALILQSRFSVDAIRPAILTNIGMSAAEQAYVPELADFIPDALYVRAVQPGDMEVLPTGERAAVDAATDARWAIDIIDIKHTSEANPSYCAELALYAVMLSNWIRTRPHLQGRYFVSTSAYLWTRFNQADSALEAAERAGGATQGQLLAALVADCEDGNLRFYLAAVRRFFDDVARVVRIAESHAGGLADLEWHVTGSCSSCDWLGDVRHLSRADQAIVTGSPDQYCLPAARATGHLSLIPGITKAARKVLQLNAVADASVLARSGGHPAFQLHTTLKRDARALPARSQAILTTTTSNDAAGVIASLAPFPNLHLYASVNFDSSAGLITALGLSGYATAYQRGQAPLRFTAMPFVVDQKNLPAEWVALEGFLTQIATCIERAEQMLGAAFTGQIHFWEERQFKELCNAIGRHLPRVMALVNRKAKALAWIFPPEEFVARPESLEASTIVIVEDIVRRLVFAPTPHVITLFDTSEHYSAAFPVTVRDSYYREYLSNAIPRERIYEIWANVPTIRRGTVAIPRNTVIAQFSDAIEKQCRALQAVCERLRADYQGQFKAKATRIPTSIPQGARSVAFDSKLWIWWDALDFNAAQLESHIRLSLEGDRLEATYEAILLTRGRRVAGNVYEFDVAPSSTEAKFKEDERLALGKLGRPGLPLEHAATLLRPGAPPFAGDPGVLHSPLWSVLDATLLVFDRQRHTARISLTCFREPNFVNYLLTNSAVDLLDDVFLCESKRPSAFNWANYSSEILQEVGTPTLAVPDPNASAAMGIVPPAVRTRSPTTPVAEVLWDAARLNSVARVPTLQAQAIARHAAAAHQLNTSQEAAVLHAAERALTVVWGPPGTGKTNTLAALIHSLTHDAANNGRPLNILVTGPTYKAVEEVVGRAVQYLSADPAATASIYFCYPRSRFAPAPGAPAPHVAYANCILENGEPTLQPCLDALRNRTSVTIVGSQIRQARRFSQWINGAYVSPVFDVAIIDESSQVQVSYALSALCGLRSDGRVVIAGDYYQMPPITSIDPPTGAEYLVGSIQTYVLSRPTTAGLPARSVLDINYRSNEHLVKYARSIGYPNSLTAAYPTTRLQMLRPLADRVAYPAHLPWCTRFDILLDPVTVVATLLHDDEVSSQGNHYEARVVAGFVWMLRHSVSKELEGRLPVAHQPPTAAEFWSTCVGIVTPHRAQRALVIRELEVLFPGEKNMIDEAVDTVERFQGGERHTIIVTYGVADTDVIRGEEAFLMQLERTNVAISRAMAKCVVVMPDSLAAHIPEDKKALTSAFALKDYVEEFCKHRYPTQLQDAVGSRRAEIRVHA